MPSYRAIAAGDLHKLHKDISTIVGYADNAIYVQKQLMSTMSELGVTHFFCLSDWYHKGYSSDVGAGLADVDLDRQMCEQLNGNVYSVIGNHMYLGLESNPEFHLIQPHPYIKARREVPRKEQLFKTVNSIMINGVQISFAHCKLDAKSALEYKLIRNPEAKYHIALYHTHLIVPYAKLCEAGYNYSASSNTNIAEALDGVDYAIVGDVHKPLGQFKVKTKTGDCTMCVPGSLTNVDSSRANRHTSVNLPLIDISEDGVVSISLVPFDLHTNNVTFKEVKDDIGKLKSTKGNVVAHLYESEDDGDGFVSITDFGSCSMTYTDYLKTEGYTETDKKLIMACIKFPEDIQELMKLRKDEDSLR